MASQKNRVLYTQLTILDKDFQIIDKLSGQCTGGNYSLTNGSDVRRTCSVNMILKDKFLPSEDSPFWVNKRFKLEVGVEEDNKEITWYGLGVYVILKVEVTNSIADSKLSISGGDLVCELNGDVSGQLAVNYKIELPETESERENIGDLIKGIIVDVLGYTNYMIEKSEYVLPSEIEKDADDSYWDVVSELVNLYYTYEAFFDVDGQFIFQKKSTNYDDPVVWDSREENAIIDINRNLDYANVRNKFIVNGKLDDDNTQYGYTLEVKNQTYPDNPFTIEKLGSTRVMYEEKDKYNTNEQCKEYAEYLMVTHTNCADQAMISCVPLYFLEINDLIYLYDEKSKVDGKYAIDNIDCDLGHGGVMSITAHKVYGVDGGEI